MWTGQGIFFRANVIAIQTRQLSGIVSRVFYWLQRHWISVTSLPEKIYKCNAWMHECWNQNANTVKLHQKQKHSQFPDVMKLLLFSNIVIQILHDLHQKPQSTKIKNLLKEKVLKIVIRNAIYKFWKSHQQYDFIMFSLKCCLPNHEVLSKTSNNFHIAGGSTVPLPPPPPPLIACIPMNALLLSVMLNPYGKQ